MNCVLLFEGLVWENGWLATGPLMQLNESLQASIREMLIPRDRICLEQAIGNGKASV
jgi:hypothetical protein